MNYMKSTMIVFMSIKEANSVHWLSLMSDWNIYEEQNNLSKKQDLRSFVDRIMGQIVSWGLPELNSVQIETGTH